MSELSKFYSYFIIIIVIISIIIINIIIIELLLQFYCMTLKDQGALSCTLREQTKKC